MNVGEVLEFQLVDREARLVNKVGYYFEASRLCAKGSIVQRVCLGIIGTVLPQ